MTSAWKRFLTVWSWGKHAEPSHIREMAYHPELIGLCESIIAAQSAEVEQMEMWLCEWYDHCDGGNHEHMGFTQALLA